MRVRIILLPLFPLPPLKNIIKLWRLPCWMKSRCIGLSLNTFYNAAPNSFSVLSPVIPFYAPYSSPQGSSWLPSTPCFHISASLLRLLPWPRMALFLSSLPRKRLSVLQDLTQMSPVFISLSAFFPPAHPRYLPRLDRTLWVTALFTLCQLLPPLFLLLLPSGARTTLS